MNWVQRIGSRLLRLDVRAQATDYGNFYKWFEPRNIFDTLRAGTLADNETIFSAVSRLSNTFACQPVRLYGDNYQLVNNKTISLLNSSPNPNMNKHIFKRTLEVCRNTAGNGYALKDYDSNYQVKAFWILDPGKVEPVIAKETRELWYQIQGDNGRYFVHNMDMIHVTHIFTIGYKGISPLDVLKNTVDFDAKVKTFSLDNIDKAITASFILNMATQVSKEKKEEILQHFKNFYQENGGVLLEEAGTKITPIVQKTFIDTKLFESEKITRGRVASVYNMPVSLLSETEGIAYQSQEQMSLEYIQYTQVPIDCQYEAEFDRKLLTTSEQEQGYYHKFNIAALLRGDMKTRADFYTKAIRSGFKKPNEVRALEEDPPEEGGDQLFVSGDLYPITQERVKK